MKIMVLVLALFLVGITCVYAQDQRDEEPREGTAVDKKTEREVLAMENKLKQGITRPDATLLKRILAEYYADSFEGSERAAGKNWAISHAGDPAVPYFSIDEDRRIFRRADIVFIEGFSETKARAGTDVDDKKRPRKMRIQRLWTKKSNKWLLVAQTKKPMEEDDNK
jgi:hypothetical protein